MGLLKNEYKSFLDDIEKNIKDKEDLNYIKQRFVRFMDAVLEEMDYISSYKTEQIEAIKNLFSIFLLNTSPFSNELNTFIN